MIWVKLVHVAAIAIWSAGLLCLPGLYTRQAHAPDNRLKAALRFLYVAVVSPAAFVAIGSGAVLVFLRESFEVWFSVKLALVGGLVIGHILAGLALIRLFEQEQAYAPWRSMADTGLAALIVVAILTVVLAKPDFPDLLPEVMNRPGGLAELLEPLNPFAR